MKKLVLIFFVLCFSIFNLKAQGVWTVRDSLPDSAMIQGIPGFSIGNYGYAGLGDQNYAANPSYKLFQFDPSTNTWKRKADFPGMARVAPACFVICNRAYLVTGSIKNGGACVNECWEYDGLNDTWTKKSDFPGSVRVYAVAFAIDSFGYVGTGANELSDFRKDFYKYNPYSDTWTRVADLPGIARSAASGFAVNGKGYVCFGQDSLFGGHWLNNDMWEYDPITNIWVRKSNLSCCPYYCTSGFAICNSIYIGTGWDSVVGVNHAFWEYNTRTDAWTQVVNVPGITKIEGSAFSIGDTGYYGFGWDSTGKGHNIFDKFFNNDSCTVITTSCNSDGIGTISNCHTVKIYPNPCINECNIEMPDDLNEPKEISLTDMSGRKVCSKYYKLGSTYIFKRTMLKDGIYLISVKDAVTIQYAKLIIIN